MATYTDQTGRTISLLNKPERIVSIVPSQTELLYYLGLEDEVCGITKFCIHPTDWFDNKKRVGGTKTLNIETIKDLNPDLIIGNKEENIKEQVTQLENEFPVWISDVITYTDALEMITMVGTICYKEERALRLVTKIENKFKGNDTENHNPLKAIYLIWKDPFMTTGGDTFIHNMMQMAGFQNVFESFTRYPQITLKEIAHEKPDVLLLSTEPYPFTHKHIDELKKNLPTTKMVLVDGELFSWYGSRMLQAPAYFTKLRQQINSL
ncbi:MAG TPA: helical backbone metal receptor [Chitinophagaceae bacterium]|nr:helical backbone metal receptor [Chitinophagaceae bacterium]